MNLMRTPWAALMDMQPQRCQQIACFIYGWVEREHVLNMAACAVWWMRAVGLSGCQLDSSTKGIGNTVPQTEPLVSVQDRDRVERKRHGSPPQAESFS